LTEGAVLHELAHYVYYVRSLDYPEIEREKGHGPGFCQIYRQVLEACEIDVPYFPPYEPEQLTRKLAFDRLWHWLGRKNFTVTKIKQHAWNEALIELNDEADQIDHILFRLEHEEDKPYCRWIVCEEGESNVPRVPKWDLAYNGLRAGRCLCGNDSGFSAPVGYSL